MNTLHSWMRMRTWFGSTVDEYVIQLWMRMRSCFGSTVDEYIVKMDENKNEGGVECVSGAGDVVHGIDLAPRRLHVQPEIMNFMKKEDC